MVHDVTRPTAPFVSATGRFEVHQIPAAQDNLVWVIVCAQTGEAAVVDGPSAAELLPYLEAKGIALRAVLNTHHHGDHVGVNADLRKRGRLEGLAVLGPAKKASSVPGLTRGVDEGDVVKVGALEGRVWLTEGHVDGHVSFVFDDVVFCGDTMFGAGCGYLFDGPPTKMHTSLERLAALPPETRVCCAHEYTLDNLRFAWSVEPENEALAARIREARAIRAEGGSTVPSTIGLERATNPFLRHHSPTLRARVAAAMPERVLRTSSAEFASRPTGRRAATEGSEGSWEGAPRGFMPRGGGSGDRPSEKLTTPAEIFAATRALKDRKDYRAITDDALPG